MIKQELRKIYKEKRKALSEVEINNLQKSIYKQIFNLDFSSKKYFHIFLPIEKQKEINTYPIINHLKQQGKTLIISKSNFKDSTLQHFIFDDSAILEINKYGIPEPVNAVEFDVKKIDVVFVPLLISDQQKYRVGYGKGFYDRFLSNCKKEVFTIGLNFFKPIEEIGDLNKFDFPLNTVIYPK